MRIKNTVPEYEDAKERLERLQSTYNSLSRRLSEKTDIRKNKGKPGAGNA